MACTTIVTASNGYKFRPMIESDFNFFMEIWKDFPQGVQSYEMRLKRFSEFITCNEGYGTEANIKADEVNTVDKSITWTFVLEKADGTPVGMAIGVYEEPGYMFAKFNMVHPSHRGQKHWTAITMLTIGLARRLEITHGYSWMLSNNPVNSAAIADQKAKYDTAGIDTSRTDTTSVTIIPELGVPAFNHEVVDMFKNLAPISAYETLKSNNSTWADVTFTYSST